MYLVDAGHADGAVARVDVGDLAGDAGRQVRAHEGRGVADVLDGDVAAKRGGGLEGAEHLAEVAHARRGQRLDRSGRDRVRSEEHTSELQSLMRNSYAVFCLKKKDSNIIHSTPY